MLKPPVMLALPSRMASLKLGATMTRESRVAASWFCGCWRTTIFLETSAYCLAPSSLRLSWISTVDVCWPLGPTW